MREQLSNASPMGWQAEDTHHAGAAVPACGIAGVWGNAVPPDDIPNLSFVPINHAAPLMNQPVGLGCGIGAMDLHLVIFGSAGTLLTALTGNHQNLYILGKPVNIRVELALHLRP